jgi:hypothetical protein
MRRPTALIATATAALSLAAAPAAMAHTRTVGSTAGEPTQNICLADFACTYVNYQDGKPTDVVKRSGTIRHWSVRSASGGGAVQLRVLRPQGHGRYRFVRSSARRIPGLGLTTFPANLKVRRGDVLALANSTSELLMRTAGPGAEVRLFDFTSHMADGQTDGFARTAPMLHVLLSASVRG